MIRTGVALALLAPALVAQDQGPFRLDQVNPIPWRNLGPANMGGRVTDLEIHSEQPTVWYVATAGGGLWKTSNSGTTWTPQFQNAPTVSIGDVAVAPSNSDIVWIGTGEENARNSTSWGDGVYKSTDAGETWTHMGLAPTFQIGHIAIHPTNPDVVFVAALGRLWSHNSERGVYRTTDGGDSWEKVFYLDDKTGCIDVRIDPSRPEVVYAAMYERLRDEFDSNNPVVRFGEKAGLFRSDDGGDSWKRLSDGLPTNPWGRTGLAIWAKDPSTVFAIIETERSGWATGSQKVAAPRSRASTRTMGFSARNAEDGARIARVVEGGAAATAGFAEGDVITRWGEQPVGSYRILRAALRASKDGDVVAVAVQRGEEQLVLEVEVTTSSAPARGDAYMGVTGEDADGGARLTLVTPDGPSATAGLEVDDVITRIGEAQITSWNQLGETIGKAKGGDKTTVTVTRGEQQLELAVTYGTRPTQSGTGRRGAAGAPFAGRLDGQRPNVQDEQGEDGYETGGIFRSDDRGETWRRINSLTDRPFYFSVIAVDPQNADNIYSCGINFYASHDGGKTFKSAGRGTHADHHAIWVDPTNSNHVVLGCDGGMNVTWDQCKSWEVLNNLPIGQFYHADVDNSVPYRVYGGLQDNGTWGGPSRTRFDDGVTNDDWVQIYGGDGFRAHIDPTDPATVYATSQGGNMGRVDMRTGGQDRVQKSGGRYNWDTPFFLSPHNPRLLYFAGNHAHRSLDRGQRSERITDSELGLTERGTATAMAESPRQPGLLYVGTDDGALWRSLDDGFTWKEIHANVAGLPGPRYVSSIHPSAFETDRVYVTFDGHRSDDFATHVYVSEDAGDTWTSLIADLPDEPCFVIREDPVNESLLFLGTEFSCYVSLDRGEHWFNLGSGLPTVAVRDLAIQDRDSDLIAATHGRGIWILDIAPLRQLTSRVATDDVHLFRPETAILWQTRGRYRMGERVWRAPNPPAGAVAYAMFAAAPERPPVLTIHDVTGEQIASVKGVAQAGLQRFVWDGRVRRSTEGRGEGRRPRGRSSRRAPPGSYSMRLSAGDETLTQPLTLVADPATARARTTETSENRD